MKVKQFPICSSRPLSNWLHPLRMDLAGIWRSGWTQYIYISSAVNQTTNSLTNFSILSHILLTLALTVSLTRLFDGRLFLQVNVDVSNDVLFQVPTCGCNRTSSWSWLHVTSVSCSCGYLKIKIILRQLRTDSAGSILVLFISFSHGERFSCQAST